MITIRNLILCTPLLFCTLSAEDFASYRRMKFGGSVAATAKQAETNPIDVRTIHDRPALIQELEWRPRSAVQTDPVKEGLLSFFNGQLSRIVVTYDSYKIEGLTADDMVEAISASYGKATKPDEDIAYRSVYGDIARVIARWENADYSYNLVRTGDQSSFALVLFSKRLDGLAQTAMAEAVKLDAQEAPKRELESQKKRDEEERMLLRKARSLNKPNFRP